eukprot:762181-Hanusia_phi.AAC.5
MQFTAEAAHLRLSISGDVLEHINGFFSESFANRQSKSVDLFALLNASQCKHRKVRSVTFQSFFSITHNLFRAMKQSHRHLLQEVECFFNGNSNEMQSPPSMGSTPSSLSRFRRKKRKQTTTRADETCVGDWGYQWCTEMFQPFSNNGIDDMYSQPMLLSSLLTITKSSPSSLLPPPSSIASPASISLPFHHPPSSPPSFSPSLLLFPVTYRSGVQGDLGRVASFSLGRCEVRQPGPVFCIQHSVLQWYVGGVLANVSSSVTAV